MNKRVNITSSLFDPSVMRNPAPATPELELSRQIYQITRSSVDGIITVTPALAARILELLNFKRQRRLKPGQIISLKNTILGGLWNPNHPISFARVGEQLVGVNLQHRMHAIVEAQTAVRTRVIIGECTSEEQVAEWYSQFDPKMGARGEVDAIAARDLAGGSGLTLTTVSRAMAALKVIMNNMMPLHGGVSPRNVAISMVETRMAEFPNWLEQVIQWDAIMHTSPKHVRAKLKNSGVMAVGLYTLKHQPAIATQFWVGVAENDKLAKDDPRARLLADFVSRKGASARDIVQSACLAWNAWHSKRPLGGIRCDADNPIHLAGTPLAIPKK